MLPEIGSYDQYIDYVYTIPLLKEEEEKELLKKYKETGDRESEEKIIMAFLRVPVAIVRNGFYGADIPREELIQEGNIGLIEALRSYDLSVGVRFYTHCFQHIKYRILDAYHKNNKLIRYATSKPRLLIANNHSKYLPKDDYRMKDADIKRMASELNVSQYDIVEYNKYLTLDFKDIYESSFGDDGTMLCDIIPEQEQEEKVDVYSLIDYPYRNLLDERERKIIDQRWISSERTFSEVSKELGVSIERCRQIEKKAFGKIKNYLSGVGHEE